VSERADAAREAIANYRPNEGDGDGTYYETEGGHAISDLITDLLHLADEDGYAPGVMARAWRDYVAEKNGGA
jgi:hypothetical protein